MRQEPQPEKAAEKIVGFIKERGVCLCEANAPAQLLEAAHDEAEQLWEDGLFGPPLRVSDDRAMLELQCWNQALADEEKVFWLRTSDDKVARTCNALKLLAGNIADFSGGLGQALLRDAKVSFDKYFHVMLSCYTGDRQYNLHVDNGHGDEDDEGSLPDNGMRLTSTYFINVHWDPAQASSAGGLDIHLTDPSARPDSMAAARKAPKLRIAPHADTLAIFLSERMAHQVIRTEGPTRWYAMTLWSLDGASMQKMTRTLLMRQRAARQQEDSDDD